MASKDYAAGLADSEGSAGTYTKQSLTLSLQRIRDAGWTDLAPRRVGKDGGFGNTLEDLLGIAENNLAIADYGEFELKTHRSSSNSLISLFRFEPSPRERSRAIIPRLISSYGWPLSGYGPTELSLRVDIDGASYADRGFIAQIDRPNKRIELHFDSGKVPKTTEYLDWLRKIERKAGLGDLDPVPFWSFEDLQQKVKRKLRNLVFAVIDSDGNGGRMRIRSARLLKNANVENLVNGIEKGHVQIEFSARTHHNHGTAFRTWERYWPELYEESEQLL